MITTYSFLLFSVLAPASNGRFLHGNSEAKNDGRSHSMEEMKGCQMAGRTVEKSRHPEQGGKNSDIFVESCSLSVCVCVISANLPLAHYNS
jgi:hypothetical protein